MQSYVVIDTECKVCCVSSRKQGRRLYLFNIHHRTKQELEQDYCISVANIGFRERLVDKEEDG